MASQIFNSGERIFNWVMSYVERWDKLSDQEYAVIAGLLIATVVLAVALWKAFRLLESFLYRKYQLHGWQANRGKDLEAPHRQSR